MGKSNCREPLCAVSVNETDNGGEYYAVGCEWHGGAKKGQIVTAIEWSAQNGHMAEIPTIQVFINGALHSEHPFHNVQGVYYAASEKEAG